VKLVEKFEQSNAARVRPEGGFLFGPHTRRRRCASVTRLFLTEKERR
jgi:hypothetical protein